MSVSDEQREADHGELESIVFGYFDRMAAGSDHGAGDIVAAIEAAGFSRSPAGALHTTRERLLEALTSAQHAPMETHDGHTGGCLVCPVPLHALSPDEIADALLAADGPLTETGKPVIDRETGLSDQYEADYYAAVSKVQSLFAAAPTPGEVVREIERLGWRPHSVIEAFENAHRTAEVAERRGAAKALRELANEVSGRAFPSDGAARIAMAHAAEYEAGNR